MPAIDLMTLFAHVTLGSLAVAAGAVALAMRKGAGIHVGAGRIFVFTMGLSSVLGGVLGALKYETLWITFHAGILGATLVASGVLVLRLRIPTAKRWFVAVAFVNAVNGAGLLGAGIYATTLPDGRLFGFASADYFFLFGMAAIVSTGDLRIVFGTSLSGKRRIAQHLLRMCIGFFIAAGSAFTGPGASAFPQMVQGSGILSLPEPIIVIVMVFWLWRTLRRSSVTPQPTAIPKF